MRRDQTGNLILNVSLNGLKPSAVAAQGDKAVRITCMDFTNQQPAKKQPQTKTDDSSAAASASSSPSAAADATAAAPAAAAAAAAAAPQPRACTYLVKTKTKDDARSLLAAVQERLSRN